MAALGGVIYSKFKKPMGWRTLLIFLLLSSAACQRPVVTEQPIVWTAESALHPAGYSKVGDDLDQKSLLEAVERSLAALAKKDGGETVQFGGEPFTIEQMRVSLREFAAELRAVGLTQPFFQWVEAHYQFYRSAAKEVLFTGYFEPLLRGSLTPESPYCHPLYRRPDDLVAIDLQQFPYFRRGGGWPELARGRLGPDRRVQPHWTRDEIDHKGALAGKNLEIAWVEDPIDLFFLHVQGSGVIELENGKRMRVGYDDQNGHPYKSIGRFLIDSGRLTREEATLPGIRAYLCRHPREVKEILAQNPSYIFFRVSGDEGPMGSLGVPLTPGRSIAVDRSLFPLGGLALIETEKPVLDAWGDVVGWEKFRRFVCLHDTGGAIRGPGRVDLFTGAGAKSGAMAGSMRQPGTFFLLVKK